MELKDFIKETLSQIIDAVSETQEKYKDKHVLICPDDIQSEKENIILTMNLIMNIITERPKYKI